MNIEDPFVVGIGIGLVVWLGQELVKYVLFRYNRRVQTKMIKKTLIDLYERLEPRKSRDDHQYNTLFEFESKLEGLVQYAIAIDLERKVDVHSVIKQIASILNFVWRGGNYHQAGSESERKYWIVSTSDLELIKEEIESISWLETKVKSKE
ncbi:MAG: hypothetical protein F4Y22_12505 [Gammaproteobacteria bacterium]|nr:hypothetical protein [Gammaproteobacteria bacterium]MYH45337.1 hypothetical protein [Gammaproteobacteria bacterium]MYL14218.1 hypothetical protein [Gammaproteobacteria bacterium]